MNRQTAGKYGLLYQSRGGQGGRCTGPDMYRGVDWTAPRGVSLVRSWNCFVSNEPSLQKMQTEARKRKKASFFVRFS